MWKPNLAQAVMLVVLVLAGSQTFGIEPSSEKSLNTVEIMVIEPVMAQTCLAVKVEVAENQVVEGLMWYNNDEAAVFPYVLATAGYVGVPPNYEETLVLVENVTGAEDGWSELLFGQAVTSETGIFYVVFQFPPFATTTGRGAGPGIGYEASDSGSCVFFSAEGEDWTRLITSQRVLIEPIYADSEAKSGILVLPKPSGANEEDEAETSAETKVVVKRTELGVPYPNPFNPMTKIPFALKDEGPVLISIYDIRGRMVKQFDLGFKPAGMHEVVWLGRDGDGRRQASGVYFARMETQKFSQIRRLVLVK